MMKWNRYGMQMIALQLDHWQVWENGGNTYRPLVQTLGITQNLQRPSSVKDNSLMLFAQKFFKNQTKVNASLGR